METHDIFLDEENQNNPRPNQEQSQEKTVEENTEQKAETEEKEQKRAEHEIDEVLHQNVRTVLTTCESSLTQGKSWLHPENQHGCQQHPYSIE